MKLAMFTIMLAFVSCKTPAPAPVCETTAKFAAPAVATALNCTGVDAIATDLTKMMTDKGVCEMQMQAGTTGNILCPMVATYIVSYANGQIPAAWGCTLTGSALPLVSTIQSVCEKAVTF